MRKNNKGRFIKNMTPWNKGKKMSKKQKDIMEEKVYSKRKGKNNKEIYGEKKANKIRINHIKSFTKERRQKISKLHKGIKLSEQIKKRIRYGEDSSNWQGGKSFEPYDKEFNNKFKRAIRKRDNQICMSCGIHREKLKRALDVHHINYNKLMSIPQNCIALCNSCHIKTNFNRKHWTTFFQSLLLEKYNYNYSETFEPIINLNKVGNY